MLDRALQQAMEVTQEAADGRSVEQTVLYSQLPRRPRSVSSMDRVRSKREVVCSVSNRVADSPRSCSAADGVF